MELPNVGLSPNAHFSEIDQAIAVGIEQRRSVGIVLAKSKSDR